MHLNDLIKDLDKDLIVNEYKKTEKTISIICERETKECECPFCGESSSSVHSKYTRTLKDLPIQNNEVILVLSVRKFFCANSKCNHKTFGERFDFVESKAVRTNRLDEYIKNIGLRNNSMDTVRDLKDAGIKVSSNTVLRVVKKNKNSLGL